MNGWVTSGGEVVEAAAAHADAALAAYAADPELVEEHAGQEMEARTGGYGRRQIFELVQNGADQLQAGSGQLQVVVTDTGLYCANQGRPFSPAGLSSILHAYLSRKDDRQIGRFGLGFKSVLGVTSRPTILSRSGSFQFSPEIAARIRDVAPEAEEVPLLRIAGPVDPEAFLEADPVAAELADWASTVVVLPFDDAEEVPWLGAGVRGFPKAFLAFADHVESLVLEDRPTGLRRSVAAERSSGAVSIREEEVAEDWFVFEAEVGLDEKARDRAGKLADRDKVTVKWAVRPGGGRELGQFWSYFPTDDETTLRGVLNTPWLLSEDRRRLVEGPYNEALLEGAAELVLDSIETLSRHEEDVTAYLELMPGRGREPRCWADDLLTGKTNELMRFRPSVPLINGELELPAAARLHPPDLPDEALQLWSSVADPGNWIAHGIERQKDRRARVERYLDEAGVQPASLEEWFEAAIVDSTPETGAVVARLAGALAGSAAGDLFRCTPFVLTEALEYSLVREPGLMLPGQFERDAAVTLVHAGVAADEGARTALEGMGVREVSAEVELRRLVAERDRADWERFWLVARQVPSMRVVEALEEHDFTPRVMTLVGEFRPIVATLLPGACVPADGSRDRGVTIDLEWHRDEVQLLKSLGCTDGPGVGYDPADEPWFSEFRQLCVKEFLRVNEPARPSEEAIEIVPGSRIVGPMATLRVLGDEGTAALTQMALQGLADPHPWTVRHRTQDRYTEVSMPNPSIWLIREEGLLPTPLGPLPPADCVGPGLALGDLVPAPSCSTAAAEALGLAMRWGDVPRAVIEQCLAAAAVAPAADAAPLYAALALEHEIDPPEAIRCVQAGVATVAPRESVVVSDDESVGELLAKGSACVLPVADREQKRVLVEAWGLTDAAELISRRIAVAPLGDPVPLLDEFRPLRRRIDPSQRELELQRCEEIRIIEEAVGGTRSSDVAFVRDGTRLYCLDDLGPQAVLREIGRELGIEMPSDEIERVLRGVEDRRVKDLTRQVRGLESDPERLAMLLEEEALRSRLPRSVLDVYTDVHGEPSQIQLAELAISVHGTDVIKAYAEELEESGFTPPSSWRGGRVAREFVRSLGFPPELAGFQSESRPPELVVEGRPKLPPLHEYQRSIAGEMGSLFQRDKDNRGMLTLPTGSGKTRVAIEACIDAFADRALSSDLILWVAQSHELCDQAVQAWSELWRARELDSRLTIGRLWASNDVGQATDGAQVVVATIHKLQNVLGDESYAWLSRPGAVLIDEAHGSIGPTYTRLLEWLGLERGKIGAPLVGLSATPYRGRSREQTERLAARYGNRRLDVAVLGEGDHYPQLQEMGVISRVVHETLEGAEITLSDEQMASVKERGLLPKAADTRLGEDIARSRRLLDHVGALPEDWPVLIFAASVENAQALAGLLNHAGISAASISAETPAEARRWYLRRFRAGDLRVITNYSVLAEGFDAPSVRAVYVARPVFAPNRYQQMVGRGLRGPLNGGEEECLIVDVEDNVLNLDELLAFHRFEYLWDPEWAEAVAGG